MGGKSKKQTIGYKYFLGMHQVLCQGPIDKITRITVDDRVAWTGSSTGGPITINKPELFGGESREGGVSGTIDIEMGGPSQNQNSYLVQKLGSLIPAYRGVVGAVFRRCYLGNNPYLKPWRFRGQRIYVRQNGIEQWYPEKAGIPARVTQFSGDIEVRYYAAKVLGDVARCGFRFYNSDGAMISESFPDYNYEDAEDVWTFHSHTASIPAGTTAIRLYVDMLRVAGSYNNASLDTISAYLNGDELFLINPSAELPVEVRDGVVRYPGWDLDESLDAYELMGRRNTQPAPHSGSFKWDGGPGIERSLEYQEIGGDVLDMNPAHIIRECLTDPDWGLGYTDDDIDNASFTSAADTLHSEGLGISLLWDRQIELEQFINEIRRHIDAALYVSRETGKFVLKLVRNDFDPNELVHLNESNISRIDDPTRASFGELVNSVTVNYWDSSSGKDASLTVTDPAMVLTQGAVINTPLQYPGLSNARTASIVAQRDLRSLSTPGLKCTIYADSTAMGLNVGDPFKLSWRKWGVNQVVMRVANIAYGTGRKNQVRIEATQDTFDTPTTPVVTSSGSGWTDPSVPPSVVSGNLQLAFEIPYYELVQANTQSSIDGNLASNPEIGFVGAASARANAAINARMWTDDGTGYEQVGTLDFCPTGQLASDITKTQTSFTLVNGLDLEEVQLGSHFQIGDELLRIDSIDITTGAITAGRGVLDTVPAEHAEGDFVFFWDAYEGFDPTEYVAGEEVGVKITPVSGSGVVNVDDAIEKVVLLQQRAYRPYPPGDFRVNGDSYQNTAYSGELILTWAHRDRTQQTSGTLADHTAANIGPEVGTTYRVQGYLNDALVHTEEGITGTSATWTPPGDGQVRVEVHSKRDNVFSLQAPSHSFLYLSGGALRFVEEENDIRVTEDNDTRGTED